MALWDNIQVGDPLIDEGNFQPTYRDDFNTLSVSTSSEFQSRDANWKRGFLHGMIDPIDFRYGSDEGDRPGDNFVHAAINDERQVYPDERKPHPSGWSGLSVVNGKLVLTSRLVDANDAAEYEWARLKGAYKDANEQYLGDGYDIRAKYVSEMLSGYGRISASFFRTRIVVKVPYGADGSSADFNQRSAAFAAAWFLQEIGYGWDINGDLIGNGTQTYAPGRPNGSNRFFEIDTMENFGESATIVHQTVHQHPPGTAATSSIQESLAINTGSDVRANANEYGFDLYPDRICFFINGVYTHIVETDDEIRNGLFKYVVNPAARSKPLMVNETTAQTDGRQQHHDGSTRYMKHTPIINIARDGGYPRRLARTWVTEGYTPPLPAHQDTLDMEVELFEMKALVTENPDQWPILRKGVLEKLDGTTYVETIEEDTEPPTVPTNVAVSQSGSGNVLAWDASTDNRLVTGYNLFRDGQYFASVGPTANEGATDTASNSATAVYTVSAYDAAGNQSAQSAGASFDSDPGTGGGGGPEIPTIPQNLTVTTANGNNTLNWSASTDNIAVTGYNVFRDNQYLASVNALTYVDEGNTSQTAVYTVGAYDGDANLSAESEGATAADSNTNTGGGTTTTPTAVQGYAPTLGFGIRYRQGAVSGEIEYYLESPELVGPGTWDISDHGGDATLLSDDLRGDRVRFALPNVSTLTQRVIRFVPD